ncbi:50S ribosome-binding GTPase [Candidatus Woesearchaeota archaeon]|nr:50S ribosome-binding GTPase [Candidatus Woesearchaeota archaeon]
MNFQGLSKIEKYQFYLDVAVKRANKKAAAARLSKKRLDPLKKSKDIEREKLDEIKRSLVESLDMILRSFPSFDQLDEFYQELVRITLDYVALKKSLGSLNWAAGKIEEIHKIYIKKITGCRVIQDVNRFRQQFMGRISSILRQVSENLDYLEECRKIMREYPTIKTSLFTVAISGFPNVGKSTLLSRITTSRPEINTYAFTTKSLNLGYDMINHRRVQFIDTPGTLNRVDKMNNIEKQAYLAIKYVVHAIVFVFDLTESYPLADQHKLLMRMKGFDKPLLIYLSKTDLLHSGKVKDFVRGSDVRVVTSVADLRKEISRMKEVI